MKSNSFDAIIVGAGFGGSICAARLAEKGMKVLILERGPWWGPLNRHRPREDRREFPRGIVGCRKLMRNLRTARKGRQYEWLVNADGLLEAHRFDHLNCITASGVGGGSHIYTNILEEPPAEFFASYPDEITGEEMHPYFDRVRDMLRPAPVPEIPEKDRIFSAAVAAAGLPPVEYPDLAIVWGKDPACPEKVVNAAGIVQYTSTNQIDVFVGCEDGSKTTMDLTYIPVALRHGATLRPLCEVVAIGGEDGGYWVRYRDFRSGGFEIEASRRLVLAAGGLNTQRLLFEARDGKKTLPKLPATLGKHFSPNADSVAMIWKAKQLRDSSQGPSVGAISRVMRHDVYRFALGEMGLPVQALPLPRILRHPLKRSVLLFGMGRDISEGKMNFDGKGLTTSISRLSDPDIYGEIEDAIIRVGHRYRPKRFFSHFLSSGRDGLFSVHPLGGCSMGPTPETGFTDHRGEVFGHPGLFVADGSLYPKSPGTAPSMTIAAFAERQAELMV